MTDNAIIHSILEEYPDREADALRASLKAEEKADYLYASKYLWYKEKLDCSIEDAKMNARKDDDYQEAKAYAIEKKVEHNKVYNKLLSARRQAELIVRGL